MSPGFEFLEMVLERNLKNSYKWYEGEIEKTWGRTAFFDTFVGALYLSARPERDVAVIILGSMEGELIHTNNMRSEREKTNNLAIVQHYNPYHGAILIHDYSRGHTLTSSLFSYCSRSVCSFWLSSLLSSCSLSLRLLWASIWVCMSVIVVWNLELTSFLLSSSSRCRATLSSY